MCGIACLIDNSGAYSPDILERFTDAVAHRGPDGRGFAFFDGKGSRLENPPRFRIGLGHRRLSIMDLSESGAQPMSFGDGSFTIVFNGEIYNHIELRAELEKEGFRFKSHCDTEVLLAAYAKWGSGCLGRFNGMWAFVIFDKRKNRILMSRDRIGVKPLYWWKNGGTFAVASEIKQFFTLPGFKRKPNGRICCLYLATGYENPPETFFEGIHAFPPGHFAEIDIENPDVRPERFWIPAEIDPAYRGQSRTLPNEKEITDKISGMFSNAVKFRLRSDVPVGGCLSGGLDSSAIFMEMENLQPETTFNAFSACFDDESIDERPFMEAVVGASGARHIKSFPTDDELIDDLEVFLKQHDEPVGSISMYAQYRIMKSARENKIPVLLDGQGGDELFSGYWPSYFLYLNRLKRDSGVVALLSHLAGAASPGGNRALISEIWGGIREFRRRSSSSGMPFLLRPESKALLEGIEVSRWHTKAQALEPEEYRKAEIFRIHLPRLLKWEDRNSMAFSIESRVPFLDVNLVQFVLSIPPGMNMRNGWTKYLFRKAMDGRLPEKICWRRDKKGFETPQDRWMRNGPLNAFLRKWASGSSHPAAEFVESDFSEIRGQLESCDFNSTAMFRLFCLDKWMGANP